jgi:hypothetical protein
MFTPAGGAFTNELQVPAACVDTANTSEPHSMAMNENNFLAGKM